MDSALHYPEKSDGGALENGYSYLSVERMHNFRGD